MEEELKKTLAKAIGEFSAKRAIILQKAFTDGGQEAVSKIEEEFDAMRDAYFELLKRQLDKNSHLYLQLLTAATAETEKLRESVAQLNNINNVIQLTTAVMNLVARVIIVLGV